MYTCNSEHTYFPVSLDGRGDGMGGMEENQRQSCDVLDLAHHVRPFVHARSLEDRWRTCVVVPVSLKEHEHEHASALMVGTIAAYVLIRLGTARR
jgi:hypothetical protein